MNTHMNTHMEIDDNSRRCRYTTLGIQLSVYNYRRRRRRGMGERSVRCAWGGADESSLSPLRRTSARSSSTECGFDRSSSALNALRARVTPSLRLLASYTVAVWPWPRTVETLKRSDSSPAIITPAIEQGERNPQRGHAAVRQAKTSAGEAAGGAPSMSRTSRRWEVERVPKTRLVSREKARTLRIGGRAGPSMASRE